MKITGDTELRGTEVHFLPDDTIFSNIDFHYDVVAKRLRELSFLNNGVKIRLVDERNAREGLRHRRDRRREIAGPSPSFSTGHRHHR